MSVEDGHGRAATEAILPEDVSFTYIGKSFSFIG
jgi:hypothetical protein